MVDREIAGAVETAELIEETYFETIKRLAALDVPDYERARKAEAKRLGMRTSVLDREVASARPKADEADNLGLFNPASWPESVDGAALLDRIVASLRRHIVMPEAAAHATALWCVHTFSFQSWQHTPRLAITAPEKGCGKSVLLDVISCLVPRALLADSLTEAVAFRLAESHKPTFLIDEYDSHLASKNPDDGLRGILNSGHAKGHRAYRCVGDSASIAVQGFSTFSPVALAGIGNLPSTLADRSVQIVLQRRRADDVIEPFRSDRTTKLRNLARQAARWCVDNTHAFAADPSIPDTLFNRRADVWRPLLAIADVAGGDWPARARAAAVALERSGDDAESIKVQLLGDIRTAFEATFENHGEKKMASAKLAEYLHGLEDRRWPEWRHGKPITPVQIARLLKAFGISPCTIRVGAETIKGYRAETFAETFSRYLPPISSVTSSQPAENCGKSAIPKRNIDSDVTDQNSPKPALGNTCDGVTVQKGKGGAEARFELEDDPEERAAI